MKYIVDKNWVKKKLALPNIVILDCRFSLGSPQAGEIAYEHSHITGAIYCHLEKVMSGPVLAHGGRHPLPDLSLFRFYLENAGIKNDSVVVAYDNGEGAFAARLWWLMKYIGHEEVYVLNGGYKEWEKAGYPVDEIIPSPLKTTYNIQLNSDILATYTEVKDIVENNPETTVLIDSREPKRYLGIEEPIDKVAGRIPGAINKFWNEGLENSYFKPMDEQKQRFYDLNKHDKVIVYCGSGVTAAPNYLMLHELGFENLKLYIGSYSDWVSYEENQIDTN